MARRAFLRDFGASHPPRLVGFLAVFGREPRGNEDVLQHSSSSEDELDDDAANYDDDGDSDDEVVSDADDVSRFVPLPRLPTFAGGAARLVAAAFNFNNDGGSLPDLVRDCRNGHVLVIHSGQTGTYAMHRPLRRTATGAADVTQLPAPPLPVEQIEEPDHYVAQVVLVGPGANALSSFHSYELTYPPRPNNVDVVHVELRVNILEDGAWVTHTSSGSGLQARF